MRVLLRLPSQPWMFYSFLTVFHIRRTKEKGFGLITSSTNSHTRIEYILAVLLGVEKKRLRRNI